MTKRPCRPPSICASPEPGRGPGIVPESREGQPPPTSNPLPRVPCEAATWSWSPALGRPLPSLKHNHRKEKKGTRMHKKAS